MGLVNFCSNEDELREKTDLEAHTLSKKGDAETLLLYMF
jgi:hypothetical protein